MGKNLFRVADFNFCLAINDDSINGPQLLPSLSPFFLPSIEAEDLLFTLHVLPEGFAFEPYTEEVGQFDCGGSNYGVYRLANGGYFFEISDYNGDICCRLQTNSDFSDAIATASGDENQRSYALTSAIMLIFAFSSATYDTLLVHSSVTLHKGKGYMFLGKSGTGKSTHSQLWIKYIEGCELLNDDNPVIRIVDGKAIVYGTPWSGKTPCYRNLSAPIGAIVRLEQKKENRIEKESPVKGFASLLPACSSMIWDKRSYDGICHTVSSLMGLVSVYHLGCLPDEEAARLCNSTVVK